MYKRAKTTNLALFSFYFLVELEMEVYLVKNRGKDGNKRSKRERKSGKNKFVELLMMVGGYEMLFWIFYALLCGARFALVSLKGILGEEARISMLGIVDKMWKYPVAKNIIGLVIVFGFYFLGKHLLRILSENSEDVTSDWGERSEKED